MKLRFSRPAARISLATALASATSVPYHPGAARYFAERGVKVERKETEKMSAKELDQYKKSLRAESEERKKLKKEAWKAYNG